MPSDLAPTDTALAILAGGRGTRMGGPKAWLTIRSQPILEYLLDRFDWPGPTILVTAPGLEHPPGCDRFALEVTDPVADHGPVRGMLTALAGARQVGTQKLVIATVDMPLIGREQLLWLATRLSDIPDALGRMPVRNIDGVERIEPFPCALQLDSDRLLSAQLEQGVRAVHTLVPSVFTSVPAPAEWNAAVWTNLNRPEDLAALERSLTLKS